MQLWQLGLLVIVGISIGVGMVHASGGSRKAKLVDAQAAVDRFAEDYPEMIPASTYLTSNSTAAFLALPDQSVGIVQAFGDRFITRVITSVDGLKVTSQDTTLSLKLSDFTFGGGTYHFAQASTAQTVRELLLKMGKVDA